MDYNTDRDNLPMPPARRERAAEVEPPRTAHSRIGVHQGVTAPDAAAAVTGAAPSAAPTRPCGITQNMLFEVQTKHAIDSEVWSRVFFKTEVPRHLQHLTIGDDLSRCIECGCTIGQHRPADQAVCAVPAARKQGTATPEELLGRVRELRARRPLSTILGASFLASDPRFRKVEPSLNRDMARFPYVYNGGNDLVAQLRRVHAYRPDVRRPVLLNVGVRGSGKTMLLLRALEAIPRAEPTLDVARMYITFNSTTTDRLQSGGDECFKAALLLRAFHAALSTLGLHVDFKTFLDAADWEKFINPVAYLPRLADALGVQTLAIAVDEIAVGVEGHMPRGTDLAEATKTQLDDLFKWADIPGQSAAAQAGADEVVPRDVATAVVVPILSCYFPRYARAAETGSNRTLVPLQADLAPCVDDIIARVGQPPSESLLVKNLSEFAYRQQYLSCGGHFMLCGVVCNVVQELDTSPSQVQRALDNQVRLLVGQLTPRDEGFATMMAQVVSGMTFNQLQQRHGDAAAPLDPFFQSDTSASNLPLIVAVSHQLWSADDSFKVTSPLIDAFRLWKQSADRAVSQTYVDGIRKAFEEVVVHGLALRWAACLAPTPPTTATPGAPRSVEFCAGRNACGAYLDSAGKLRWINLSSVMVCEPCTHVAAETFPTPGASIAPNTYTLATSPTNPVVEGGGSVSVSSLPDPLKGSDHVYFTVQTKHTVTGSSNQFAAYAAGLPALASDMPGDAPCIHLFCTPQPYKPWDKTVVGLLQKLRPPTPPITPTTATTSTSVGDAARARAPPLDIVACVNVQTCLTPSLAWTLTCAGFATPSDDA
jgi:hypothetical protein